MKAKSYCRMDDHSESFWKLKCICRRIVRVHFILVKPKRDIEVTD